MPIGSGNSSSASLDIDPADLVLMGGLSGSQIGGLSPFQSSSPLPDSRIEELSRQGILDTRGNVRSDHTNAWSILAAADHVTRVQLVGSAGIFEYYAYFGNDGKSVSLKTVAGKLRIEDPAATEDVLSYLANMIGSSASYETEFRAELGSLDALVFAGLIDEQRRRVMKRLADGSTASQSSTAQSLETELKRSGESFISLSSVVRSVTGMKETPSLGEIETALPSLVASGHARRKGKGFQLTGTGVSLARGFLNVESVLTLLAIREGESGGRQQVGFNCAIAGIHNLLSIENVEGTVHFETLTSRGLLGLAEFFLREGITSPVTTKSTSPAAYCGKCGSPTSAGDRFCRSCGAALQATK